MYMYIMVDRARTGDGKAKYHARGHYLRSTLPERHLKLRLAGPGGRTLTALGWNMADRREELADAEAPLRLAGTPFVNEWNGRRSVEIELADFQWM